MGCGASIGGLVDRALAPLTPEEEENVMQNFGEMAKLLLMSQGQLMALYQKVCTQW